MMKVVGQHQRIDIRRSLNYGEGDKGEGPLRQAQGPGSVWSAWASEAKGPLPSGKRVGRREKKKAKVKEEKKENPPSVGGWA